MAEFGVRSQILEFALKGAREDTEVRPQLDCGLNRGVFHPMVWPKETAGVTGAA